VADVPETCYAKTPDGAHIAYQVLGDGPLQLLFMSEGSSHLELAWEIPAYARVFRRLGGFSQLVRFDIRGTGLSDPLAKSEQPTLEERALDVVTVLKAVGSERAAVLANNVSGPLALFFAASHPHLVSSLVLDGCYARLARAPDYPWGWPPEVLERSLDAAEHRRAWTEGRGVAAHAPNAMRDPAFAEQYARYVRSTGGPSAATAMAKMLVFADVRRVLTAVQAPTLVLYRSEDRFVGKPHAVYLAEHIAGAKLVEVPGQDNLIFAGDSDSALDEVEEFLTGARHAPATDRVLATVLFTDIVGSTERAAELGDRRWRHLLEAHDHAVRRQLERFRGREVKTAGDGFLATFDGPGRAIECARAVRDAVRAIGIEIRIGLHTGEIELRGDDIAGIAVHIGARVAASAGPGDILVSGAVPPLVVGSSIEFDDRGEHELKGVPGTWRLFSVVT
jgi:class 3 adenylate cyclase